MMISACIWTVAIKGTHPLESDMTTVRSAFRQELELIARLAGGLVQYILHTLV